jgi:4-amino-4-deoxy-L-arabinose transferase-like glycosyltransferase
MRRAPSARLATLIGGVLLLVSLSLPWYEIGSGTRATAWEIFPKLDLILAALALAAIAAALPPSRSRLLLAVRVGAGAAALLVIALRLISPPAYDAISPAVGAFVALAAAAAIVAGAFGRPLPTERADAAVRRTVAAHPGLIVVLTIGLLLRIAVEVAYWPAVFFSDSWAYLGAAYGGDPIAAMPDRPSGYPADIHLITIFGRDLGLLTIVQHLAGLAIAVLLYALCLRLGVRKWLATVAAAVVVLDSYLLTLEQTPMPEVLTALVLLLCVHLAITRNRGALMLAGAGLLLAVAVLMRTSIVFVLPVALVYLLWARRPLPQIALAVVCLALPLLAYGSWYQGKTGAFGLSSADGWFLYGRVGEIANCGDAKIPKAARPLCVRSDSDRHGGALYHIWDTRSVAVRTFGYMASRGWPEHLKTNKILKDFAIAIIRDRPVLYGRVVAGDSLRFFEPGVGSRGGSDVALKLPARPEDRPLNLSARKQFAPGFQPRVAAPAGALRAYQSIFHVPRWLLAGLVLATFVALLAALVGRGRFAFPQRREAFLLVGGGVAVLVGSAATSEFVLRYLIPVVPLLLAGGFASAEALVRAPWRELVRRPREPVYASAT